MARNIWQQKKKDGQARRGELTTTHGVVQTPFFMPIATVGAIKGGIEPRDIRDVGFELILSNTYHLHLAPGEALVREFGGLAKFMRWDGPILTDSGGFQVFSLASQRKLTEEGAAFRSHRDGSKIFFSPEKVIQIQYDLGIDIAMQLDECIPAASDVAYAAESMRRSLRWAQRCKQEWQRLGAEQQMHLFGIVQGVYHEALRRESAEGLSDLDLPGYAIGGVVETFAELDEILAMTVQHLPDDRPRYLMGIGTPENILQGVAQGIDMFDCVLPTRNGRHGKIFSTRGDFNVTASRFGSSDEPLDADCPSFVSQNYSRGYLRHLFKTQEVLAMRLAAYHNLAFYSHLMKGIRLSIEEGRFDEFRREFEEKRMNGER